ncbi:MAG: outer membrane protein assembly factor BamA [Terriglobia bacterium]
MRRRYATTILALSLLIVAPTGRAEEREPVQDLEGRRIASISFEPARQPMLDGELRGLLPFHDGEAYHSALIRAAIERLHATGRYKNIQVDATVQGDTVALKFITEGSWFIGHIDVIFEFAEPPSEGQMINASGLELGRPFDPEQIPAAEENIRKLLVGDGYFNPAVSHQLAYDDIRQQVKITFQVDARKRAVYTKPVISGDTSVIDEDQIIKATRWRKLLLPGYRTVTQNRTHAGIDNIRIKYQNSNRLLATITLDEIKASSDGRKAVEKITVNPGPVVNVRAEGAKISNKNLRQNVPVFEEHTVDADLISEGANNLRDYFQAHGYFDAEVRTPAEKTLNGKTEIDYVVIPGIHHRLVHLEIEGNKYFDTKTIRERMLMTPRSFEVRSGRYSEALRKRDEGTIASLYVSNGFRDVRVTSTAVDNYAGKKGDEAVSITITEGIQYRVAALEIVGPSKLDLRQTLESLSSQKGQIFSEFNIAADREAILLQYGKNGFANAAFQWDSTPGLEPHMVNLKFTIDEGDRLLVREVVVTGLETTRRSLVNQQLDMAPGNPLSSAAMADTQRRLYDLGVFAQVNMAVQNPDGAEDRKYVLYDVQEAHRYSLTTGFGAEFARIGGSNAITDLSDPGGAPGVSPRVSLDLTRLNFLGIGQSLSLQSRLSTLQRRAALNYFVPRIFGLGKFDATFSVLYDDTHDVRTFRAKRAETSAQIVDRATKAVTIFYRFNYRDVNVSNLNIDPLLLPRLAQSVRVGVASFNIVQDRRDDPTDPHKGIYNTLDVGLAARQFGSQTSFVRVLGRNAGYYRIGEKLVFARETQFGVQPAYRLPPNGDPTDPIPLPERFFGGGGSTQRGFPENQAGPRDTVTGFPLGGSALFFNSTELRFPLYGANVSGVLFEDAGNVYSSLSQMSFRVRQRDIRDFSYMAHAVGFGIRYRTPVGPLRFDLAYSLNPPKYNGFPGTYVQLVQCSAAHTCQASSQQISHFQFFFSIGQAF